MITAENGNCLEVIVPINHRSIEVQYIRLRYQCTP
jgi:hypothetical protein